MLSTVLGAGDIIVSKTKSPFSWTLQSYGRKQTINNQMSDMTDNDRAEAKFSRMREIRGSTGQ